MATSCSQLGIVPISFGSTSLRSIEGCENVTPPFCNLRWCFQTTFFLYDSTLLPTNEIKSSLVA